MAGLARPVRTVPKLRFVLSMLFSIRVICDKGNLLGQCAAYTLSSKGLAFTKARTCLCSTHSNLLCITRTLKNTTLVFAGVRTSLQHPPLGTASHYRFPPFARACHMMQHAPHPPLYQPQPQRPLLLREA